MESKTNEREIEQLVIKNKEDVIDYLNELPKTIYKKVKGKMLGVIEGSIPESDSRLKSLKQLVADKASQIANAISKDLILIIEFLNKGK